MENLNENFIQNISFDCNECAITSSFAQRLECSQCSDVIEMWSALYLPASLTRGNFGTGAVSADALWQMYEYAVLIRGIEYDCPYALNSVEKMIIHSLFPTLNIRYSGIIKEHNINLVIDHIFRYVLRNIREFPDITEVNEDYVSEFAIFGDTNGSLSDIAAMMSHGGVRTAYGVVDTRVVCDDEFLRDTDLTYRERPFHYRLVKITDKYVIALMFATAECSVMERSVPVQLSHSVTTASTSASVSTQTGNSDKIRFVVIPDYDDEVMRITDLFVVDREGARYYEYVSTVGRDVVELASRNVVYITKSLAVVKWYEKEYKDRILFMQLMYLSNCSEDIQRELDDYPEYFNRRVFFKNRMSRTRALVNFVKHYLDSDNDSAMCISGDDEEDGFCYRKLFNMWDYEGFDEQPSVTKEMVGVWLRDKRLMDKIDHINMFNFLKVENDNRFHISYAIDGLTAFQVICVIVEMYGLSETIK